MNQKFEYYIQKILNKVLLQLLTFILFTSILIIIATILRFRIGPYFLPVVYIFIGLLLSVGIIINYLSYRRNIWLLKHYETTTDKVIQKINKYKDELTSKPSGATSYLFQLFNKNACIHYDEALEALNKEEKNESRIRK